MIRVGVRSKNNEKGRKKKSVVVMTLSSLPPLEHSQQIRVLFLQPSRVRWSEIKIIVKIFTLGDVPEYDCLSYTWTKEKPTCSIQCNGQTVYVRPNLLAVLRRLRHSSRAKALWIDAICINQNDPEEKNHQVPLMHRIYHGAKRVTIWLGEDDGQAVHAFPILNWIYKSFRNKEDFESSWDARDPRSRSLLGRLPLGTRGRLLLHDWLSRPKAGSQEDSDEDTASSLVQLPRLTKEAWASLQAIIQRPWFTRVWVVQEVVLAKDPTVLCGKHKVPWAAFTFAADCMGQADLPQELGGVLWIDILNIHDVNEVYSSQDGMTGPVGFAMYLCLLLKATINAQATDPRDKFYGLYGIATMYSGAGVPEELEVDYELPVETVYRDVMRYVMEKRNSLDVMILHSCTGRLRGLPSWVPDWSSPRNLVSAANIATDEITWPQPGSPPTIGPTEDEDELAVWGKRLLTVTAVRSPAHDDPGDPSGRQRRMEATLRDWIAAIGAFPDPAEAAEALAAAIVGNTSRSLNDGGEFVRPFTKWLARMDPGSSLLRHLEHVETAVGAESLEAYVNDSALTCLDMRLCILGADKLCIAPATTQEGDLAVVLRSAINPFIIRPDGPSRWTMVGPCYIHDDSVVDGAEQTLDEEIVLR